MRVATVSKRDTVTFWRVGVTVTQPGRDTFDTGQKSASQCVGWRTQDKPAVARPMRYSSTDADLGESCSSTHTNRFRRPT
jgi:hypothetical protein